MTAKPTSRVAAVCQTTLVNKYDNDDDDDDDDAVPGEEMVLRQVDVKIISQNNCRHAYGAVITNRMLCAGQWNVGLKDACQGDSGGPLVHKSNINNQNKWRQYGVVSWGKDCALPNYPGVYTNVVQYLNWIQQKTGSPYLHVHCFTSGRGAKCCDKYVCLSVCLSL